MATGTYEYSPRLYLPLGENPNGVAKAAIGVFNRHMGGGAFVAGAT